MVGEVCAGGIIEEVLGWEKFVMVRPEGKRMAVVERTEMRKCCGDGGEVRTECCLRLGVPYQIVCGSD